jgi:hypothetical protein
MKTTILIPTNLIEVLNKRIDTHKDTHALTTTNKAKLKKRLIEIWYYIYTKQQGDSDCLNLGYFTSIDKTKLEKFDIMISGNRFRYTQLLKIMGKLIEINVKYSATNFSKSYKINFELLKDSNLSEVEIDFTKIFKNIKSKEYWLEKYPKQKGIIETTYDTTVELSSYIKYLNHYKDTELKPKYNKKTGKIQKRFLDTEHILDYTNRVLKLNFKNIWFKLSSTGRFYNTVSNLPGNSVGFTLIGGKKTVELDLANAQPLLLSTILTHKGFAKDCSQGIFYDVLAKSLNLDRTSAKLKSYKHIFFGSKQLKSGIVYDALESSYKGLIRQINEFKSNNTVWEVLQQMESDIFVKEMGKYNFKKCTRHDSILFLEEDYDLALEAIEEILEDKGIVAKIV